jgi:hypothetical protein
LCLEKSGNPAREAPEKNIFKIKRMTSLQFSSEDVSDIGATAAGCKKVHCRGLRFRFLFVGGQIKMRKLYLSARQGCQMVHFLTKKSELGYILDGLKKEEVRINLWIFGRQFGIFYGHLVYFMAIL